MKMTESLLWAQRSSTLLAGFAIPLSTAATNLSLPLAILLLLIRTHLAGNWQGIFNTWRTHPIAKTSFILLGCLILAMFYSAADWNETVSTLSKYRELFYLPCFLLLFQDEFSKRWGLIAFLAAMGLTLLLSYLVALSGYPIDKATAESPAVFKNYITQGILLAIAAYVLAVEAISQSEGLLWRKIAVTLALFNAGFMIQGRTGYLIIICLILLYVFQFWRWRGLILGILGVSLLSMAVYFSSGVVKTRIDTIGQNIEAYHGGNTGTSVGLRLEFYKNSSYLISQHPIFGTGTGSFSTVYKQLAEKTGIHPTTNPHNEFLMLGVQLGIFGIGLFAYLLWQLWQFSFRLNSSHQWMAQGVVVMMFVGCLVNSLLLDFTEGHVFAYLVGWLYANLSLPTSSPAA
ncbi:MAG: hypothetical protein RIS84_1086 [Pseudomonadota bacterium]|jgi:O-antigen ligase